MFRYRLLVNVGLGADLCTASVQDDRRQVCRRSRSLFRLRRSAGSSCYLLLRSAAAITSIGNTAGKNAVAADGAAARSQ